MKTPRFFIDKITNTHWKFDDGKIRCKTNMYMFSDRNDWGPSVHRSVNDILARERVVEISASEYVLRFSQ